MVRGVRHFLAILAGALAAFASGCGGDGGGDPQPPAGQSSAEFERTLERASDVEAADFPDPRGRSMQEMANTVKAGPRIGLAVSVFTPGENRLAFGLIDSRNSFVYGPTAVYVGRSPDAPAEGPFPAPADPLVTKSEFRSQTAASEEDIFAAIYDAEVPLERAGRYSVLVMTKLPNGTFGAVSQIEVVRDSPIPAPGERPPSVETDTLESAGGVIESIDTRVPPDDMHDTSFDEVFGQKPVALLFATPQLCESRVCGPVVDIAAQLKADYGDRVEFIHQEVYVDNEVSKGLRAPLREFDLQTEPWLFTVDRQGRVAARLEGSFGIEGFRQALEAAL